jgi:predicted short-subunit dehydrogenase-like oxidoreductase (DUF2520 family)
MRVPCDRNAYYIEAKPRAASIRRILRSDRTTEPRLVSAGRTGTGRYFIEARRISGTSRGPSPAAQRPVTALASLRFAVVGAGKLGCSLALALRARGADLVGFSARTRIGRAKAEAYLGGRAAANIRELVSRSPVLFIIAVPDDALTRVADELGRELRPGSTPTGPVVAHTSGAASVAVLSPCMQAGAATLVFHPLQTFTDPNSGSARFEGSAIAITPSLPGALSPAAKLGFALADGLGARPFLLPDEKRVLYHAAATFASNYLVALEYHAERLFVAAGLPPQRALPLFLPLVRATLDNIAAQGTIEALTGPLSRGDGRTIVAHIRALREDAPDLVDLYKLLGLATLDLIRAKRELGAATVSQLAELLGDPNLPSAAESDRQGAS